MPTGSARVATSTSGPSDRRARRTRLACGGVPVPANRLRAMNGGDGRDDQRADQQNDLAYIHVAISLLEIGPS